ncbi:hypothetical protein J14TS2_49350 [Bacillus sp. J14TS2]|uniref:FIMAH domain-containing protein n=1 Tax=Bacillus sp. J14TS2 TaxID=2807188 RepID=UPI001B16B968|nr:right-handed parallel beta-helix repeat-containing protein [Bacillus sp. J14TS2]GIN74460.1 hypothetical protein J14TS2_49350 [Bacillus sp. J14TS2]
MDHQKHNNEKAVKIERNKKEEEVIEKDGNISRRKLLAYMGLTSAVVVSGGLLSTLDKAFAADGNTEKKEKGSKTPTNDDADPDADQIVYRYSKDSSQRLVGDKLRELISVKDFGAKGDGKADDQPAIQQALDYAKQLGGAVVYVPLGTYKLGDHLSIYSKTHLICAHSTVLLRYGGYMLLNGSRSEEYEGYEGNGDIVIEGGIWDARGNETQRSGTAVALGHGHDITIRNVTIKNVCDSHAIEVNSSTNVLIKDCMFNGFVDSGERGYAEAIQIDLASKDGFPAFGKYDLTTCDGITIRNCQFGGSDDKGTVPWPRGVGSHANSSPHTHKNIHVIGCEFYKIQNHCVRSDNWNNVIIQDNVGYQCEAGIGVYSRFEDGCKNIIIRGNTFYDVGNYSQTIIVQGDFHNEGTYGLENVIVSDNYIERTHTTGIWVNRVKEITISNNTIIDTNSSGIYVKEQSDNVVISNNKLSQLEGTGIQVATGVTNVDIIGNNIKHVIGHGIQCNNDVVDIIIASNKIFGVQGKNVDDDHLNDGFFGIWLTEGIKRVSITGNLCKDDDSYTSDGSLRITDTCKDIIRTSNIFAGKRVTDHSDSKKIGDLIVGKSDPGSALEIKDIIDELDQEGEFESSEVVYALKEHLTAVAHFEKTNKADKVVKHMKGFKGLLDQQKNDKLISSKAYSVLSKETDAMVEDWS